MSKYEELKDYAVKIQHEYQSEFEDLKNELASTSTEDTVRLREIVNQLKYCVDDLGVANRVSRYLVDKEKEIRIKLNGFYDEGNRIVSLVYQNVYKEINNRYRVGKNSKYFKSKKGAINYSISLGEREDWLHYAYTVSCYLYSDKGD